MNYKLDVEFHEVISKVRWLVFCNRYKSIFDFSRAILLCACVLWTCSRWKGIFDEEEVGTMSQDDNQIYLATLIFVWFRKWNDLVKQGKIDLLFVKCNG